MEPHFEKQGANRKSMLPVFPVGPIATRIAGKEHREKKMEYKIVMNINVPNFLKKMIVVKNRKPDAPRVETAPLMMDTPTCVSISVAFSSRVVPVEWRKPSATCAQKSTARPGTFVQWCV